MTRPQDNTLTLAQRLQALTLVEHGVLAKRVEEITEVSTRSISHIKKKARSRGYDPEISRVLKMEYVEDAPRSGQPSKVTPALEEAILTDVRKDRNGREKSSAMLAFDHVLSSSTILKILKKNGFRACKSTKKPGLTSIMKEARLKFCIDHQHWTLEDWKNVIWSDETSVMLNAVRGKRLQWRTSKEMNDKTCIRRRWKGRSEFMFWGCFSDDKKVPFHIWKTESAKEKKTTEEKLKLINKRLESEAKLNWELENGMRRMRLRNSGGRQPRWIWDQKHGKIVRDNKKGEIDWYRYQKNILIDKLLLFATECMKDRPNMVVQEDKAPCHTSKHQDVVFMDFRVLRFLWPSNSPDLNMIEPERVQRRKNRRNGTTLRC